MDAANTPQDEGGGGSAHIAKMFFSLLGPQAWWAHDDVGTLEIVAYVPADRLALLACDEWLTLVLRDLGADVDRCVFLGMSGTDGSVVVAAEELSNLDLRDPERAILAAPLQVLQKRGILGDKDLEDHLVEVGLDAS
mmetsp:Transcript_55261/g.110891  ORF Transcript_55261/g.110891 Transcript_55261/m.110891 type:complete len:137 (+) Transcript_55261:438-848(+)